MARFQRHESRLLFKEKPCDCKGTPKPNHGPHYVRVGVAPKASERARQSRQVQRLIEKWFGPKLQANPTRKG